MDEIHPTHIMIDIRDGKVCVECDRCTCHRPSHLVFICPAKEYRKED